ncbi:zinc finger protein, putative [Bodo saltans]|uniref:Zinc finger protein, putative n=1 Tax=Bodo saltans TaxID=75058 RepID=A0A0S4IQP1_BODSA|nr:zinc finger protein, putative [Bodo saltans]|eukprot:CUE73533.1 zinc finger protein, putative [Bodo saltans]
MPHTHKDRRMAQTPSAGSPTASMLKLPQKKQTTGRPMSAGEDFFYTSEPQSDLTCQVCLVPYVQPLELKPCGHVTCYACCEQLIKNASKTTAGLPSNAATLPCPVCRTVVTSIDPPPRIVISLLDALEVRCAQCNAVSSRNSYASHECVGTPMNIYDRTIDWGNTLLNKGAWEDAVEEFTTGIAKFESVTKARDQRKKSGEAAALYSGRARAQLMLQNIDSCHRDADSAVTWDETSAVAHYLRGAARTKKLGAGETSAIVTAEARIDLERAIALGTLTESDLIDAKGRLATLLGSTAHRTEHNNNPSSTSDRLSHTTDGGVRPSTVQDEKKQQPKSGKSTSAAATTQQQSKNADATPDTNTEKTSSHATPVTRERVLKNTLSLLKQAYALVGDASLDSYDKQNASVREGLLRDVEAYIIARPGQTTDEGEDLRVMAYLAPEINITSLCRVEGGLRGLFKQLVDASLSSLISSAVNEIMDACSSGKNASRSEYLRSHDTDARKLVVDTITGMEIDLDSLVKTNADMQRIAAEFERKRSERQWVPLYIRDLAIHRLSLIADFLLRTIAFAASSLKIWPSNFPATRNVHGCLWCGNKGKSTSVICDTCQLASYCSVACRQSHSSGHEDVCTVSTTDLEVAMRNVFDTQNATLRNSSVLEKQNNKALYLKYCSEESSRADPCGDGDQSPLPPATTPTCESQQVRGLWAEGLDFDPRRHSNSELFTAAYVGDPVAVRRVLDKYNKNPSDLKKLVNLRETLMRFSPLHSCIAGARSKPFFGGEFTEIAKMLITAGSNVHAKDFLGFSCVHHCTTAYASDESLQILLLLADAGANANAVNRLDETPILEPTNAQKVDTVKTLIMIGADPNLLACNKRCSAMTLTIMLPAMRQVLIRCAPLMGLKIGATVVFDGLVSKPHLNGKKCVIEQRHVGKFQVRIENTEDSVLCKVDNLRTLSNDSCAKCHKELTKLQRCSRCKVTSYCNKECQESHWAVHKSVCKAVETITIPKVDTADDMNKNGLHVMDLTQGTSCNPKKRSALVLPSPNVAFLVKIQVPGDLSSGTMTPAFGGNICIYNESRTLNWSVKEKHIGAAAYKKLFEFVQNQGVIGLKVYANAQLTDKGELVVTPVASAVQPW